MLKLCTNCYIVFERRVTTNFNSDNSISLKKIGIKFCENLHLYRLWKYAEDVARQFLAKNKIILKTKTQFSFRSGKITVWCHKHGVNVDIECFNSGEHPHECIGR